MFEKLDGMISKNHMNLHSTTLVKTRIVVIFGVISSDFSNQERQRQLGEEQKKKRMQSLSLCCSNPTRQCHVYSIFLIFLMNFIKDWYMPCSVVALTHKSK